MQARSNCARHPVKSAGAEERRQTRSTQPPWIVGSSLRGVPLRQLERCLSPLVAAQALPLGRVAALAGTAGLST